MSNAAVPTFGTWTKIEDFQPDEEVPVLVDHLKLGVGVAHRHWVQGRNPDRWDGDLGTVYFSEKLITHWMPMPPSQHVPPKR